MLPIDNTLPCYSTFSKMTDSIDYSSKKDKAIVCFGSKGKTLSQLDWPRGLVVDDRTNNIYVSERDVGKVVLFNQHGDFLYEFPTRIPRNFYMCIANDVIYMSSFYNDCISVYTLSGDFVTYFGSKGHKLGDFNVPQGIAFDEELNKVFICDRDNSRVQVFGDFYLQAVSVLISPRDVKFKSKKLFIMGLDKFNINIYDPCYPYTLQKSVIEFAVDRVPYYFDLDPDLNIIISNYHSNEILVFDRNGELLHTIAKGGSGLGTLSSPNGIALTKQGNIVSVCVDKPTGMIQIF